MNKKNNQYKNDMNEINYLDLLHIQYILKIY